MMRMQSLQTEVGSTDVGVASVLRRFADEGYADPLFFLQLS